MYKVSLLILLCLVISYGCSSVSVPKDRLTRSTSSFETDLRDLQEYIGDMPVDVVVAGHPPITNTDLSVVYSHDSVEATVQQAVIMQMDPTYTYLRPKAGSTTKYIRIPTKHVTRIAANGFRPQTTSSKGSAAWALPVLTGAFALIVLLTYKKFFDIYGINGCIWLFAGILAAVASIVSLIMILLLSDPGPEPETLERISKFWIIQ